MKKIRFWAALLAIVLVLGSVPAYAAQAPAKSFALKPPTGVGENYDPESFYNFYLHENGFCAFLDTEQIIKAFNALPKLNEAGALSQEKLSARLIQVKYYSNYEKHIYELRPGELRYDGKPYVLTQQQYDALMAAVKKANTKPDAGYAYYLTWMNPTRVKRLDLTDKTVKDGKEAYVSAENIINMVGQLSHLGVKRGYTRYDPEKLDIYAMEGGLKAYLEFDNFAWYSMSVDSKNLYIEYHYGANKENGYKYELSDSRQLTRLLSILNSVDFEDNAPVVPPETGKPVIYLYPEKTMDVNVKLDFKGELCTTIPAYDGGWSVTAQPDGTIANKADGKQYPYLFWDGNPDFKNWDFSSGFCVKAEDTGAFFREKLPALGLLPHEYKEFIDYWQPLLEKNKYNLITFSTEQYEAVAPLTISPAPDTVLRVHMVYKGTEKPVSIPAQKLAAPPAREGFTVVEWGGTLNIL